MNHVKKCSANRLILMQIILVHMKYFAQGLVLLQVQGNLEIVTGVFGPGQELAGFLHPTSYFA